MKLLPLITSFVAISTTAIANPVAAPEPEAEAHISKPASAAGIHPTVAATETLAVGATGGTTAATAALTTANTGGITGATVARLTVRIGGAIDAIAARKLVRTGGVVGVTVAHRIGRIGGAIGAISVIGMRGGIRGGGAKGVRC